MKRASSLAAFAAAVMVLCSSAFAEKIANPEYVGWSKFKAGAFAKTEGSTTAAGNTSKQIITTKLLEITADKAVVEISMTMDMMGQKMDMPPQKREIAATIEAPTTPAPTAPDSKTPKADLKTSDETVKVGDKEVKCKVVEADVETNGVKSHTKTWTSEQVPGNVVKLEAKTTEPMESTTTQSLVEFSAGN